MQFTLHVDIGSMVHMAGETSVKHAIYWRPLRWWCTPFSKQINTASNLGDEVYLPLLYISAVYANDQQIGIGPRKSVHLETGSLFILK